ncbi:serine protease [Lysinibacillus xylanilyticus]|uniref:serine protease n=1 Tax=Lysinibacillus xylanilyticus TaxID=582475 RepID=UPI002B2470D5|nr:serine protease [Lysinibacillus xylanilyticus]MEB2280715.1 serine protease [Lysinibacillus xylanilyticus]
MNYFILSQDERISNAVEPVGLSKIIKKELLTVERMEELEELDRQFPVLDKSENDYIDFIEKPIALLADPVKQLVEKYEPRLPFKPVVLVDMPKLKQTLYWLSIPPKVACLSAQTEFHLDGTLKKLVIDETLAGPYTFFQIEGIKEDYIIVNIELAESILRRSFRGIRLRKVQTEGKWNELLPSR